MPKDFKIGVMVGLIMVLGIIVWLSTWDSLSPQARQAQHHQLLLQERMRQKAGNPSPVQVTSKNPSEPQQDLSSAQSDPAAGSAMPLAEQPPQPQPQAAKQPEVEVERPKIKTTKFHIVRTGETLSGISQLHYNTVQNWTKIRDANPDVIKDPDKLIPGMKLTIPE